MNPLDRRQPRKRSKPSLESAGSLPQTRIPSHFAIPRACARRSPKILDPEVTRRGRKIFALSTTTPRLIANSSYAILRGFLDDRLPLRRPCRALDDTRTWLHPDLRAHDQGLP